MTFHPHHSLVIMICKHDRQASLTSKSFFFLTEHNRRLLCAAWMRAMFVGPLEDVLILLSRCGLDSTGNLKVRFFKVQSPSLSNEVPTQQGRYLNSEKYKILIC
jgi:hypothetical protein